MPDRDRRSDPSTAAGSTTGSGAVADVGGIPVAPHGHLCVLYREQAERDQLLFEMVEQGLRAGDPCLFVGTEAESAALRKKLVSDDPDLDTTWLDVREPTKRIRRCGEFSSDGMMDLIGDWSQDTFERKGRMSARAAADMSLVMPHPGVCSVEGLAGHEARVAQWSRTYPQIGVFFFDLNAFSGDVLVSIAGSHRRLWVSGVVLDNPYFIDPYESAVERDPGELPQP